MRVHSLASTHHTAAYRDRRLEIVRLEIAGKQAEAFKKHRGLIIDDMREKAHLARLNAKMFLKTGDGPQRIKWLAVARAWDKARRSLNPLREYEFVD